MPIACFRLAPGRAARMRVRPHRPHPVCPDHGLAGTIFKRDGTQAPIHAQRRYIKALPSFNIRAQLTDTLQTRFAFSKSFARPNFDQMATNVTLNNPTERTFIVRASNTNVIGHIDRALGQP